MGKRLPMMALISFSICVLAGCKAGVGQPDAGAGYKYLSQRTISCDGASASVYSIKDADIDTSTDSYVSSIKSGIGIESGIHWDEEADTKEGLERLLAGRVEYELGMLDWPSSYQDITVGEVFRGDGYAMQKIDYTYVDLAGHTFPCTHAIKVEAAAENYYVESRIKIDNSEADGDTKPLAQEAFQAYGIDFE